MKFQHLISWTFRLVIAVLISTFTSGNTFAQSGTTSVRGIVLDQQGRAIAGATVKLGSADKGLVRTAATNDGGSFTFPTLPPGTYRLEISQNGFKTFVHNDVRALVDTPANISATLDVGDISEIVNVTANSAEALLNTQDAKLGNTFVAGQVTQLPTDAREVINLLTLQPGVTRFGYVAGGRSDQANITLDGVDINEAQTNDIFTPVLRLNAEAIEEFRVTTTGANADQGRSSGAQVSLVTKGGSNEFRGALFLSGRRTQWSANNFFNNSSGVPTPKLDRNVFGGAIGGPILKNRAYFFYSYEGERTTQGATVVRQVPLANLGQGIVRYRGQNTQLSSLTCAQIATVFPNIQGCNPFALAVLAAAATRYPANTFVVGDSTAAMQLNTAGYRFNAESRVKDNSHVFRLDLNPTGRQQVYFRANYISDQGQDAQRFPDTPVPTSWKHPFGFAVGHSWVIANDLVNNFRFGLTRDAFTNQGDSDEPQIGFSGVFIPRSYSRTIARITPVYTIADDISLVRGAHTFQFGANIRLISNRQHNFANAYDFASTEPGAYPNGSVIGPINIHLASVDQTGITSGPIIMRAISAVIGRYSVYEANFLYLRDGRLQPPGTPSDRDFRTQEYDFYFQDIWKISPNFTVTAGLRYGLSRPVYEANGYEVKPTLGLAEFFERRAAGAAAGVPYNDPLVIDLSGPVNDRSPLYRWDKNNLQPRIAVAWSPNFGKGRIGWLFGRRNQSVIRGGFALTNDYFGPQLAAGFDLNGTSGYSTSLRIAPNTFNLIDNLGPRFTGFNQNIRVLPNLTLPPNQLTFPRQAPNLTNAAPIEGGLDQNLVAPIHYSWNLTYERTLPKGLVVTVSYQGRKARNLLLPRDAAAIANFVDSQSGLDWNTAATQLEVLRQQRTPVAQIVQIPYFANLFPANLSALMGCPTGYNQTQAVYARVSGSCGTTDWTTVQLGLSLLSSRFPGQHIYYQPQYGTYRAWSSIGRSDYQGLNLTVRQRLGNRLTMDFNYTYSNSKDDGSSLQSDALSSPGISINPFRQDDMYSNSDFDMRHLINVNGIFKLPIGRGESFLGRINKIADLLVGGWQLTGIFRYNSGVPLSAPRESLRWTTNWSISSYAVRRADVQTCPVRGGSLFGCDPLAAYNSFRNSYPGETGERNVFRLPGYWSLDLGLGKTFNLPREGHNLQFRWEVFNVTNTQHMGNIASYIVNADPQIQTQTPANWANFTSIQGSPRSMQFVLRYSF